MNSKLFIFIVVIAVILGGVLYLFSLPLRFEPVRRTPEEKQKNAEVRKARYEEFKKEDRLGIIAVANDSLLEEYLTDKNGRTLYTFSKDRKLESSCTGQCAELWPPFIAGKDEVMTFEFYPDKNHKNLGIIVREYRSVNDHTLQFTYGYSPLYYYAKDLTPGDIKGHGMNNFWFVAVPRLEP